MAADLVAMLLCGFKNICHIEMSRQTDYSNSSSSKLTEHSPKVRRLLGHHPSTLYMWGYAAILFCVAVLIFVLAILGLDRSWSQFFGNFK